MDFFSNAYITALLSGACAGVAADVALFPLDTIKTRLQSGVGGLRATGGFRNIYAGLGPAALGSAPAASLFFCTYEGVKGAVGGHLASQYQPLAQMVGAAAGELVACTVRVPTEVIKQRRQAQQGSSSLRILQSTMRQEGLTGLYRGYGTTVIREIPFSLIQFPVWEGLKTLWGEKQGRSVDPWQSAVCGAVAGSVSAACTTPLDVAKTRIMLAAASSPLAAGSVWLALTTVYAQAGITGLFAGVVPRTLWMSTGGFIFLGVYEKASSVIASLAAISPDDT